MPINSSVAIRVQRVFMREEELREDQARGRAVDEEVVPFDGRAHGPGDDRSSQLRAVLCV
jgi:hypothetical protein